MVHSLPAVQSAVPCVSGTTRAFQALRPPSLRHSGAHLGNRRPSTQVLTVTASATSKEHVRAAAEYVVDTYVKDGQVVGVGTGEMASYAIEYLARKITDKKLQSVCCIPASDMAASEAAFHGLPLTTLQQHPQVDVVFDEGDEVDCSDGGLPFINGRAAEPVQPQLLRAKLLAHAAQLYVLMLDDISKVKGRLGGELPVLIQGGEEWEETAEQLDDIFLGDAEIWRRASSGVAPGPRGGPSPYISPEGHTLLDIKFYGSMKLFGEEAAYEAVGQEVRGVQGVVADGLFEGVADVAVVATEDGPFILNKGERIIASNVSQTMED